MRDLVIFFLTGLMTFIAIYLTKSFLLIKINEFKVLLFELIKLISDDDDRKIKVVFLLRLYKDLFIIFLYFCIVFIPFMGLVTLKDDAITLQQFFLSKPVIFSSIITSFIYYLISRYNAKTK